MKESINASALRLLIAAIDALGVDWVHPIAEGERIWCVYVRLATDRAFDQLHDELGGTLRDVRASSGATWRELRINFAGIELELASPQVAAPAALAQEGAPL